MCLQYLAASDDRPLPPRTTSAPSYATSARSDTAGQRDSAGPSDAPIRVTRPPRPVAVSIPPASDESTQTMKPRAAAADAATAPPMLPPKSKSAAAEDESAQQKSEPVTNARNETIQTSSATEQPESDSAANLK